MKIKRQIDKLSDDEARSLLLQMLLRTEMNQAGNFPDEEYMASMKDIYHGLLTLNKDIPPALGSNIHIVFSDSSAGSIRQAIKKLNINDVVIAIPINFAIGPLWRLTERDGLKRRSDWLFENINFEDDEFILTYIAWIEERLMKLQELPEQCNIYLWGCENASEQAGAAFAVYLLKEKSNQVFIGLDEEQQQRFKLRGVLHTGEIAPEQWMEYMKNAENFRPLSLAERQLWVDRWVTLSQSKNNFLRIWQNGKMIAVSADYFDEMIIARAKKLQKGNRFIKSARLIGEVIGHLEEPLGDLFIEYRLRTLALSGVFEMKGVPRAMRFYSVRLRSKD